jgi:hypothetical protein
MRHTIELLICGTIGAYCVWRCYSVLPLAIAEAQALVAAYLGRVNGIEAAIDEAAE